MIAEDKWFLHFLVAVGLIIAGGICLLVLVILLGLWNAGFGVFVVSLGGAVSFAWLVHKLASSKTIQKWIDDWV